ncbi:MAG: Pycsar system effector family protein [Candidatus Korobacteraceae bacterium]
MGTSKPQIPTTPQKKKSRPDSAALIDSALKNWTIFAGDLDGFSQAAQRSLDTVTHLTEYQDDKANRILTAMAFMSAFAAVVFVVVPSRYPLSMPLMLLRAGLKAESYLLFALYGAFVLYALTLTVGVAFVLHAVRPRFNVPKGWKPDGSKPASYLFFEKIVEVFPTDWANAFVGVTKDDLLETQVKNAILEAYLIAEKIGVKMKWLTRGVMLFFASTIVLAVLLPLVAATLVLVPEQVEPQRQVPQQPTVPSSSEAPRTQGSLKQGLSPRHDDSVDPASSGKAQ